MGERGETSETTAAVGGGDCMGLGAKEQSPRWASGACWGHLGTSLLLPLRISHQKVMLVTDKRASHLQSLALDPPCGRACVFGCMCIFLKSPLNSPELC